MLGIESEISVQGEVSRLSISSNPNREKREKNGSAYNSSTLHSEGGTSGNLANNLKNEKIKQLRNKMHQISKNQEAIQTRMKSYLQIVEKELQKKEEQNRQLEGLISSLKDELAESRADLEILTNYVVKKLPAPTKEEPKMIRISNASSQQSDSHSSQNQSKKLQGPHLNQQKQGKSISPKNKVTVLEKSKNFSPVSKEQKKVNTSGPLISVAQRKLKSPGK